MDELKEYVIKLQKEYNALETKCDRSARELKDLIDMNLKAINVIQCCTQLKDKEKLTFEEWLKEKGFEIQSDNFYKNMHGSMIKTEDIKELYRVYTTF